MVESMMTKNRRERRQAGLTHKTAWYHQMKREGALTSVEQDPGISIEDANKVIEAQFPGDRLLETLKCSELVLRHLARVIIQKSNPFMHPDPDRFLDNLATDKVIEKAARQQEEISEQYQFTPAYLGSLYGSPHRCVDSQQCILKTAKLLGLNAEPFLNYGFDRPVNWQELEDLVDNYAPLFHRDYLRTSVKNKCFDPPAWSLPIPLTPVRVVEAKPKITVSSLQQHICILQYLRAGFLTPCSKQDLLMTCEVFAIPKTGGELRLIYDARMPNNYWSAPKFVLPDHFSAMFARGTCYVVTDLRNAFLRWPISQQLQSMCGIYDRTTGQYYRWTRLPWGSVIAPFIQQALMTTVNDWLRAQCPTIDSFVFYDDFLIVGPNKDVCVHALWKLISKLESIGVKVNYQKTLIEPQTSITWLGLQVSNRVVTVPPQKKASLLYSALMFEKYRTLALYQEMVGKATFCARCVPLVRTTCRLLGSCIPQEYQPRAATTICNHKHIKSEMVNLLNKLVNSAASISIRLKPVCYQIFVDASTSMLCIGLSNASSTCQHSVSPFDFEQWHKFVDVSFNDLVEVDPKNAHGFVQVRTVVINILEIFAIFVAVLYAPTGCNLLVFTDSQVAIAALSKLHSFNTVVSLLAAKIHGLALKKDCLLLVRHIKSELNPADAPSRAPPGWKKQPPVQIYEQIEAQGNFDYQFVADFLRCKYPHMKVVEQSFPWAYDLLSHKRDVGAYAKNRRAIASNWSQLDTRLRYKAAIALAKLCYLQPTVQPQVEDLLIEVSSVAEGWLLANTLSQIRSENPELRKALQSHIFCKQPSMGVKPIPSNYYHFVLPAETTWFTTKDKKRILVLKPGQLSDQKMINVLDWDPAAKSKEDKKKGLQKTQDPNSLSPINQLLDIFESQQEANQEVNQGHHGQVQGINQPQEHQQRLELQDEHGDLAPNQQRLPLRDYQDQVQAAAVLEQDDVLPGQPLPMDQQRLQGEPSGNQQPDLEESKNAVVAQPLTHEPQLQVMQVVLPRQFEVNVRDPVLEGQMVSQASMREAEESVETEFSGQTEAVVEEPDSTIHV